MKKSSNFEKNPTKWIYVPVDTMIMMINCDQKYLGSQMHEWLHPPSWSFLEHGCPKPSAFPVAAGPTLYLGKSDLIQWKWFQLSSLTHHTHRSSEGIFTAKCLWITMNHLNHIMNSAFWFQRVVLDLLSALTSSAVRPLGWRCRRREAEHVGCRFLNGTKTT